MLCLDAIMPQDPLSTTIPNIPSVDVPRIEIVREEASPKNITITRCRGALDYTCLGHRLRCSYAWISYTACP